MSNSQVSKAGHVFLVGAGPGNPRLITLRGVECLGRADLVLYDYLVNTQVLEHARSGAELVCLGRHGRDRIMPQGEINALLVKAAQAGKTVVRLKSGDPTVFGRAAEEIQALLNARIPFEIVPGVTAATAVSAYTGIPLTDRLSASAVAFVTGHESSDKPEQSLDFQSLASFPGTLVVYMGVTAAANWTRALIEGGRSPATPAAIVRRCSWPDQLTIRCSLAEIADRLAAEHIRPPALVVVGEVAAADELSHWFEQRPLFGRRIVVTRAAEQAAPLRDRLEELGAIVLSQPAIRITPPVDWSAVDAAIARLDQYDWLAFSSINGVHYFFDRLLSGSGDVRQLARTKLAVIGPGTAAALQEYRLKPDAQPDEFRAEGLAAALVNDAHARRFLLIRASRGREVLTDELTRAGGIVEQVVAYESTDVEIADADIAAVLAQGKVDYLTVTSSAIARSLGKLFGEGLAKTRLASISPVTSAILREIGFPPAIEAQSYTIDGLIQSIVADAMSRERLHVRLK